MPHDDPLPTERRQRIYGLLDEVRTKILPVSDRFGHGDPSTSVTNDLATEMGI